MACATNRCRRAAARTNGADMTPLQPGATIGILGGGQLGRMLALAAGRLGLQCHIFTPEANDCALQVVKKKTVSSYENAEALRAFTQDCDVITYEFENVPADTAAFLSSLRPVRPDPRVLQITQDRLHEKTFVQELGIPTARFHAVSDENQFYSAIEKLGLPAILKTRRMGYDGKGQACIRSESQLREIWQKFSDAPCILEEFVKFDRELSVIAARGTDGDLVCFDLTENIHRNHILALSHAPANISPQIAGKAQSFVRRIADAFGYVGVIAIELFLVTKAGTTSLLVNEIAPRVHNSGHWTLDGATISQFEQHVRAVAGWPLGRPTTLGRAEMVNLIGDEINDFSRWLNTPGATIHIYGKDKAVPGRKMGHATRIYADLK